MYKKILVIFTFTLLLFYSSTLVLADECETTRDPVKIGQCIDELQKTSNAIASANTTNAKELAALNAQISKLKTQINSLNNQIIKLQKEVFEREVKIGVKDALLSAKIKQDYIRRKDQPLLLILFSADSAANFFRDLAIREKLAHEDRDLIASVSGEVKMLKAQSAMLNGQKINLDALKIRVNEQATFLAGEVAKANAYVADLGGKISALTARQQQILAEKLGSLNLPTSLGGGTLSCTDDRKLDPGFSNAFAFFTYGIPHRVGMDQYGAYGRAKAGQSAEDILRAYFDNFEFTSGREGETVKVNGKNEFGQVFNNESMNIEDYLKHLHEMPSSWDSKALQAQAIAARSYALAEQRAKGYLYPSQKDQVIKKEMNTQSWIDAVEATRGKIMAQGGQPIKAWYASTSGGYTFNSGDIWSRNTSYTKRLRDASGDIGGFGDLQNKAYSKDSPCFYSAQGWRTQYNKSAWLKSEEVADIVNVIMLAQKDSSTQNHLSQTDKPNPDRVDTWDSGRVQQELRSRNTTPYSSVSSISVSPDFGSGRVTSVTVLGDAGTQTFSANDFTNYFNLRAPANIQIVGPLFNIEKK
ncbi:MAG: Modifier protein of major autolysin LytC [Candidatus Amesbacteria bacterium GW2011_GWA2_42_12]|uniref:Modifier protein of major autolysin LytC n=1 Tax=Candidatus Amesbacteria bacterium GW2011_GWA2_42_12 TaxID=1618356 RepID=A0A0G0Y7R8_9BACT|nr:MAG: Modifier protein of major autolysin LytC [Candidatus Amesbacteria bacterium GW2011_GWA2_42_12]